jgi:hypothetical protein
VQYAVNVLSLKSLREIGTAKGDPNVMIAN